MKYIHSALIVVSLVALNAAAQPAQPPTPPQPTQPQPGQPQPAQPKLGQPQPVPPSTPAVQLQPTNRMPPNRMPSGPATPPKMPEKDKLSYAIGVNIATSIKHDKIDVDIDTIVNAMKDVIADRPTRMTQQEVGETIMQFRGAMQAKMKAEREQEQAKMMAEREKQGADNKAKGEEFLAKNAKAPGVKTLPNGLQYKVLAEGDGPMPKSTDSVTVSYKGRLIDGTVFDQNTNFPTPVTGRTIKGWSEILPLMKKGAKWEVTIPADLGYGLRGFPPKIGPNAVLIFEMELLSIAPPSKPTPPAPGPSAAANPKAPTPPGANVPVVSGQIIKVPSREELDKGAKIEVITNAPGQQ